MKSTKSEACILKDIYRNNSKNNFKGSYFFRTESVFLQL